MITLTTAQVLKSVLGGSATVAFGKLVLSPFVMDPVAQTISGSVRLTSTVDTTMQPVIGSFRISVPLSELVIEVPQSDFYRRVVLSSAQNTAILNQIQTAQNAVEAGLISVGVVAGVQANGA